MSTCTFCGQPAGLFRSKHAECERKNAEGRRALIDLVSYAAGSPQIGELAEKIEHIRRDSYLKPDETRELAMMGWSTAVHRAVDANLIEQEQEDALLGVAKAVGFTQAELERTDPFMKIVKAAVLRDLMHGVLPQRCTIDGVSLNLQKDEQIVWAFPGSAYLEDRTRRTYVGRSQGVSIKIARGVYYRTGAFKGTPVEHTERVLADTGTLVATQKHLYFDGASKSFRIPYTKIVSFRPFEDGIGIMRDAATAKAQNFITSDGWFAYNLVTNLAALAA